MSFLDPQVQSTPIGRNRLWGLPEAFQEGMAPLVSFCYSPDDVGGLERPCLLDVDNDRPAVVASAPGVAKPAVSGEFVNVPKLDCRAASLDISVTNDSQRFGSSTAAKSQRTNKPPGRIWIKPRLNLGLDLPLPRSNTRLARMEPSPRSHPLDNLRRRAANRHPAIGAVVDDTMTHLLIAEADDMPGIGVFHFWIIAAAG